MSQIDVIKENVQYEQLLRESTGSNILKGEYLIKDSHPDVHEILGVDAKATVTNKEVLADKVMLEGVVTYTVLYLSIDESDIERINSVNLSEKFADYLELTGIEHKVLCDVECVVEHIQANIMNERKISVEGVRTTKWNIYQVDEFEFIKDLEGTSDIQVQKETEEINKVIGDKEIELMGKSILKATMDKPEIEDILQCSLNLHKKETKLGEDKIYFGCYCKVEVLYKGKDTDDIILLNDDIYLSKEQELIGCNADMMAYNEVDIVNSDYIVTLDDLGENRIINVEFLAKGLVKVLSKEKIDLINDAYCPSQPIDLIKSNHDIGLIHGMVNTEVIIKDNISLNDDKEKIGSIIMTSGSPVVTDKSVENDKIKLDGVVKVSVLYRTADEISRINMCTGEVPFTTVIDLKGTNKDMEVVSKVQIESIDSTIEANTIGIRITLSAWAKVSYKVNKEWIVDVVESENGRAESEASVIIYSVDKGDTLWKLAKKYNTTIEELVKINDIENPEIIIIGQKLIIPGRAIF